MPRKRHTAEQIISKLREAEVGLAGGHTVPEVCRTLGIAEQTYYRWRKEYGGHCQTNWIGPVGPTIEGPQAAS